MSICYPYRPAVTFHPHPDPSLSNRHHQYPNWRCFLNWSVLHVMFYCVCCVLGQFSRGSDFLGVKVINVSCPGVRSQYIIQYTAVISMSSVGDHTQLFIILSKQ